MEQHKDHDKVFIVNFAMVLGALMGITLVCGAAARLLDTGEAHHDAQAHVRLAERVKPVGVVVTDAAALVKVSAAAPARAPMTGDQVAANVCNACHGSGVLGAPKTGDKAAWASRGTLDQLTESAIKGKGQMPPRGGGADLTDAEVRAAVEHLLKQSGV